MQVRSRIDLIKGLSKDLQPVSPIAGIYLPALLWYLVSWAYVIVLSLYLEPLRNDAIESLLTTPQFAIETSLGLLAGVLFCLIAFQESIPGLRHKWMVYLSYFCAILWISCYIFGLSYPALESSLDGKRAHCVLESYLYSGPPLFAGYLLIYRRFPLDTIRAGIFIGISAGMLPALYMQLACMYDPRHILTHHLGPALVVIIGGALLGLLFRKQQRPLYG